MTSSIQPHLFIPGTAPNGLASVLLHGSGGDERDLVPLTAEVAPGAPTLSHSRYRRDRRWVARPDRSIDEADLAARIPALAGFIAAAGADHGFATPPVAIGFSNGAIMAAALLLTHPTLFAGAILLRPLSRFPEDQPSRLGGKPVLIIDGEKDGRRSPGDGARLGAALQASGRHGHPSSAAGRARGHGDGQADRAGVVGGFTINLVATKPHLNRYWLTPKPDPDFDEKCADICKV